jgi:hypothetical protein
MRKARSDDAGTFRFGSATVPTFLFLVDQIGVLRFPFRGTGDRRCCCKLELPAACGDCSSKHTLTPRTSAPRVSTPSNGTRGAINDQFTGKPKTEQHKGSRQSVFVAWLEGRLRGRKIEPDDQDYDFQITRPVTNKEADRLYRLAQTKKLMRMYGDWKARQN